MLAQCQNLSPPPLPPTEISPRSHPGVSVGLLTGSILFKTQDSEGKGPRRPLEQPSLFWMAELKPLKEAYLP